MFIRYSPIIADVKVYAWAVNAADIGPVPPDAQSQSSLDLFLIFVGANVVATTFQVGASLASSFSVRAATGLILVGSAAGAALVASLAPIGSRLRVPSVIAARPALGIRGAGLVAVVLYLSNFAWIALNNVIAASASSRAAGTAALLGDAGSQMAWAIALGVLATAIVWRGPAAVARADRVAVPLLAAVAIALTIAGARASRGPAAAAVSTLSWSRGLDVVIGYQVSWILMFADYSRYTRSPRGSATAVFLGLALTSAWMMPLGVIAARVAGSTDPGTMLSAVGLGAAGAVLLTLATITTNFVNIYMSSLAWKSLFPHARDGAVVWSIGLIGTALSAIPGVWLDQYTNFMVALGAVLVPVGGVLLAHYYLPAPPGSPEGMNQNQTKALYDERGPFRGVNAAGVLAWTAGIATYFAAGSIGGTVPALVVSIAAYIGLRRVIGR
jgi:NCS1 family nucleobase:cation symporter-1